MDFRVGTAAFVGGVRFLLSLLGNGAMSSEVVDELSSLSDPLVATVLRFLLCGVSVSSSVCRLIPRVVFSL